MSTTLDFPLKALVKKAIKLGQARDKYRKVKQTSFPALNTSNYPKACNVSYTGNAFSP